MRLPSVPWSLALSVGCALACAGSSSSPAPAPSTDDAAPAEPAPVPAGTWEVGNLVLTFDPSVGLMPGETKSSGDPNIEILGNAALEGGIEVEVRAWKPPFQDAPEDDPFGQTAEEAKRSAGAYAQACRGGKVDHLVKTSKDSEVGSYEELAVRGMMWDAESYMVLLHHIWTFRTPSDLCAVGIVGTEGQEIFFGPRVKLLVGRADQRFVVIVTQTLDDAGLFAPLAGKSVKEQLAGAKPIAERAFDAPEIATVRTFIESLAVEPR